MAAGRAAWAGQVTQLYFKARQTVMLRVQQGYVLGPVWNSWKDKGKNQTKPNQLTCEHSQVQKTFLQD